MTTLSRWWLILLCLPLSIRASAQHIGVTSSTEVSSGYGMAETWVQVGQSADLDLVIRPHSILQDLTQLNEFDVFILSTGTAEIDDHAKRNLLAFVNNGGHLYIQSEYLPEFDTNETFDYIVGKTGGVFQWQGQSNFDVGPVEIVDGFAPHDIGNFWYGVYGCGDQHLIPMVQVEGKYFGWFYDSPRSDVGNIISISDHDWIRRVDDNPIPRKAFMSEILNLLLTGYSGPRPDMSTSIMLTDNFQACTDNEISAEVTHANPNDIMWYVNGVQTNSGASLDISGLQNNDAVNATIISTNGCQGLTLSTDTITISKDSYSPAFETSLTEVSSVCTGEAVTVQAIYDTTLPDIRHHWFLNGNDTPIKTDYFTIADFNDGDILEHNITFFNGCTNIQLITQERIVLRTKDTTLPNIHVTGQQTFCEPSTTILEIQGSIDDSAMITWYIDNEKIPSSEKNISVNVSNTPLLVYATMSYNHECLGWVTASTQAITLQVKDLEIQLAELVPATCENNGGYIEVFSNLVDVSFAWSNGQTGNYLNDLDPGKYIVTATTPNGCLATQEFEVLNIRPPFVDTLTISAPSCFGDKSIVNLELLYPNAAALDITWKDSTNSIIYQDITTVALLPGSYQVIVDVNNSCPEIIDFTVINNNPELVNTADTIIVKYGDEITLRPNLEGIGNYSIRWHESSALNCSTCSNPQTIAERHQLFSYTITTNHGCEVTRSIMVYVEVPDPYYAPSGFSPNGDGINDFYKIFTRSDVFATSQLKIFDRWGSLVYEGSDNDIHGWDGKSYGRPIHKGVFVYVQHFEDHQGKHYTAKGSLSIF